MKMFQKKNMNVFRALFTADIIHTIYWETKLIMYEWW